jgi:hypothetical protein
MNTIRLNVLGEAKAASSGVSIKNQDKSVEITENGVTELTADSGYTGLGKVTINSNVQSGGSASGDAPDMRYFLNDSNLQANGLYMQAIQQLSSVVVCDYQDMIMIYPGASVGALPSRDFRLCACAINLNQRVVMYAPSMGMNQDSSVKEYIISQGLSLDTIESFANLTEEEFYNPATYK